MKKILVAGVGNRLMGDDGFGPHVIDLLLYIDLPPNVDVRDIGTAGITIAMDLADYDQVIFLDSMNMEGPFGKVSKTHLELSTSDDEGTDLARFTLHEVGLEGLLRFAKAIGTLPKETILIGCKPKSLKPSQILTNEVEAATHTAVNMLLDIFDHQKNCLKKG